MTTPKNPLLFVLGIRPDVIRASLMIRQLKQELGDRLVFVWSGQHYSENLKDVFFRQLGVPSPDIELNVKADDEHDFVGNWISSLGNVISEVNPCAVTFLGDTNTVLGSISAAIHNTPIVHIEGCMRSYDWRMPEEKYRTVADHLSDLIYAYLDEYKSQGLLEGLEDERIIVTGNPIVDVLETYFLSGRIRMLSADKQSFFESFKITEKKFAVMTSHRRENVEEQLSLERILDLASTAELPVIFPASYRTQKSIKRFNLTIPENVMLIDPIGYVELLELMSSAQFVMTDSGTVVEETAVLQVPSIQMRSSTERPQVYDSGSSLKFDPHVEWSRTDMFGLLGAISLRVNNTWEHGLGDGKSSTRIVKDLIERTRNPESFQGHSQTGNRRPFYRNLGFGISGLGNWR